MSKRYDRYERYRRKGRRVQLSRRGRGLLVVAGIVLVTGLFVQLTMMVRISSQNRNANALVDEIQELNAQVDNLELVVDSFHNLDQIGKRARQLGMEVVDSSSTRVVNVTVPGTNTQSSGDVSMDDTQN